MTEYPKNLDIAQRIAEAIIRTYEPQPSASGSMQDGGEVIGSVPVHLRHLHNLLAELGSEVVQAEQAFLLKKERMNGVRTIFFDALKTHVSEPEKASGITILENWDVVANYRSDTSDELGSLGELLAMMTTGGRR